MESKSEIVMRDSPEAASMRTVTGWVSRHGRFCGDDERMARYDGCTHVPCSKCGAPTEKSRTTCSDCRAQKENDAYEAMPRKEWDGVSMLYSQKNDRYYQDLSAAEDDLDEGETLANLQLVICEPNYGQRIDADYFCDETDEDGELPDSLYEAMDVFNSAIREAGVLSWSPGKFALDVVAHDHP